MAAAAAAFRKELESNPNDFVSNLQLGAILKQDQHYDEARTASNGRCVSGRATPACATNWPRWTWSPATSSRPAPNWNNSSRRSPQFVEAHVSLATVYYRLKRKEDGDRERATVLKLNAESQANAARGQGVQ